MMKECKMKDNMNKIKNICFNLVYNTIEYCTGEDTANAHIDWCELKSKEATAEIMKELRDKIEKKLIHWHKQILARSDYYNQPEFYSKTAADKILDLFKEY